MRGATAPASDRSWVTASAHVPLAGSLPAYDWIRAKPAGSSFGPTSFRITPATREGCSDAVSMAIDPPSDVPRRTAESIPSASSTRIVSRA